MVHYIRTQLEYIDSANFATEPGKILGDMMLRTIIFIILCGAIAACNDRAAPKTALEPIMPLSFEKAHDPEIQQSHLYDFMWRSFIALNWRRRATMPLSERACLVTCAAFRVYLCCLGL